MAMVTEMRIPGGEHGQRFNYRGMHRYLITFLRSRKAINLGEKATVLQLTTVLHDACRDHRFDVFAYCFLPEKLVLIIRGRDEESDMRAWVRGFRQKADEATASSTPVPVFARRYTERVLRKTENSRTIADEIYRMPVTAGLAHGPMEYEFQGSFVLATPPSHPPEGDRRSFQGGREERPRKSYGRPPGDRDDRRKSYGRPPGDRDDRRKSYGRPPGDRDDRRKGYGRPSADRDDRGKNSGKPFGDRSDNRGSFGKREGRPEFRGGPRKDFRKGGFKGPRKGPRSGPTGRP